MPDEIKTPGKLSKFFCEHFLRIAASGWLSPKFFERNLPTADELTARSGLLTIEVVSHCWRYGHLLKYQLSSLVLYPPKNAQVVMTVFYTEEDKDTVSLLEFFGRQDVPNVTWNWKTVKPQQLFRRSIGRNQAALETKADWMWFTDCDLLFHEGCLDGHATAVQGLKEILVFPQVEYRTDLLTASDSILVEGDGEHAIVDIDPSQFAAKSLTRATGPVQITHGDVARRVGYCNAIEYYQQPLERFSKCYEDRAFRWLLRTQGTPIEFPGVLRIRHLEKGRYSDNRLVSGLRKSTRKIQSKLRDTPAQSATSSHLI